MVTLPTFAKYMKQNYGALSSPTSGLSPLARHPQFGAPTATGVVERQRRDRNRYRDQPDNERPRTASRRRSNHRRNRVDAAAMSVQAVISLTTIAASDARADSKQELYRRRRRNRRGSRPFGQTRQATMRPAMSAVARPRRHRAASRRRRAIGWPITLDTQRRGGVCFSFRV